MTLFSEAQKARLCIESVGKLLMTNELTTKYRRQWCSMKNILLDLLFVVLAAVSLSCLFAVLIIMVL